MSVDFRLGANLSPTSNGHRMVRLCLPLRVVYTIQARITVNEITLLEIN